jgi:hypothetical protein
MLFDPLHRFFDLPPTKGSQNEATVADVIPLRPKPGFGCIPATPSDWFCGDAAQCPSVIAPDDVASAEPVMFAYVLDQPSQHEASRSEILERFAAIQALSETMATAKLESPATRSHGGILDALAILSRDVRELMEASFHPGP